MMATKKKRPAGSTRERQGRSVTTEKCHASPPVIFDDGKRRPSATAIPWRMWPRYAGITERERRLRGIEPKIFWHQSWYGARTLAATHFGVSRDQIMWDENYGKVDG